MTRAEYATVEIEKGSIVFSIDESELVTLSAPEQGVVEKVEQEPAKPVIVRPAPRTKK